MITAPPDSPVDNLGKLTVLAGVRQFPVRVKCASLAWHTLHAAVDARDEWCPPNEAAPCHPPPAAPVPEPRPLRDGRHGDDPERDAALRPHIVAALSKVFDPEIPVNIYELGLIYDIDRRRVRASSASA